MSIRKEILGLVGALELMNIACSTPRPDGRTPSTAVSTPAVVTTREVKSFLLRTIEPEALDSINFINAPNIQMESNQTVPFNFFEFTTRLNLYRLSIRNDSLQNLARECRMERIPGGFKASIFDIFVVPELNSQPVESYLTFPYGSALFSIGMNEIKEGIERNPSLFDKEGRKIQDREDKLLTLRLNQLSAAYTCAAGNFYDYRNLGDSETVAATKMLPDVYPYANNFVEQILLDSNKAPLVVRSLT
jgi:hypothetical protein